MGRSEPTRKDVAELAGVSETIVSYVVNDNRYVKQEKKERVLAAIKALDYKTKRLVKNENTSHGKHVVMLIDQIKTEYYGELVSDMEHYSANLGYILSISIISNSAEYVERVIAWKVDAVIISSFSFAEHYIQRLVDAGILVIIMKNRKYSEVRGAFTINTGLYQATVNGIEYLYKTGAKNIAYIDRVSMRNHFSDKNDHRYEAYCNTMDSLGLSENKCIITGCSNAEELQDKVLQMVKEHKIDALYGRNDYVACIAMNVLLRNGYKIPDDVSVIGLDDTSYSKVSYPTLTSMRMKREDIAKMAIRMISEHFSGQVIPDETLFIPELIIRESVRPMSNEDED